MRCPTCESSAVEFRRKRNVFYPVAWVYILSLLLAQLHQASSACDYRCMGCGAEFARRTGLARFAFAVLIGSVLCAVLGMLVLGVVAVLR